MTITDETVYDIIADLDLIGANWPINQNYCLERSFAYSSTRVLRVHYQPKNHSRVRYLWMAYCFQQAVGTALEPAFATVEDCSPTGLWILLERGVPSTYSYGHSGYDRAFNDQIFTDYPDLADLVNGPSLSVPIQMLADNRYALVDAGLPPSNSHDIGLYDASWLPAPF